MKLYKPLKLKHQHGQEQNPNPYHNHPQARKRSISGILIALWLVFVILSQIPLFAETLIDYSAMDDKVTSRLRFPEDGKRGHYYVERYNDDSDGIINVEYTTTSNSLEVDCTNIKVLKFHCREMYEKKSEEVFKCDPDLDSNYYRTYFIERDHFHVHVYTEQTITQLVFFDTPVPYNVTVNDREWWLTGVNYTYNYDGIVLTKVPSGHTYVDIYFKSKDLNSPVAKISASKIVIGVNEEITFDASDSYDSDGTIVKYIWDLGDGTYKGKVETTHKYTVEGNYKVILTVKDDDDLIGHAYQDIIVIKHVMDITKAVDKQIATPGSTITYTFDATINTTWQEGVKDIVITDLLHDNLTYVDGSPTPVVKDNTVTWTMRQAFDSYEIPKITLEAMIDETTENNTIITNNATLSYKGFSNQFFPSEKTNIVETIVRFNTILAPQIRRRVPDVMLYEDAAPFFLYLSPYEFDFQDTDTDLKWYVTGENESLYILSGEYSDNDVITITPTPNAYGNSLVTLWLIDSEGFSTHQPLWINITPVNDPPVFLPAPDLIIHYDDPYTFNYEPYVYDIDNPLDDLELFVYESVDGIEDIPETSGSAKSNTENAEVEGLEVIYTYPERYTGKIIFISLILFDGNANDAENIQINVTDDYTPKLVKKLPNVYLKEGEIRKNVFDLDDYFSDPDEDSLYYSFGETHVEVVINDDHTVDMLTESSWFGMDIVTFRARDPIGAIAEDVVLVFVEPINDPPVIEGVPDLFVIHYDADYKFDLTPYVSDEDNETEDLSLILKDIHIRTDPLNNLQMIMNYPKAMVGMDVQVELTVTDGINTDSETVTIRVTENWPPQLTFEMPDVNFHEDEILYHAFNLNDYFIDKDSDTLFYSYGHEYVKISINPDGSVDFSAEENWFGVELVTFRATDSTEAFVENSIIATVNPVNDAPVFKPLPKLVGVVKELVKFDLTPYINDVDNNLTELNISVVSEKMDILVSGNELIIYTNKPVKENITIIVNDGQYSATAHMMIEIKGQREKGSSGFMELLMSILWLLIVIIIIIIMLTGYTGYRRYMGNYEIEDIYWIYNDGTLIIHESFTKQLSTSQKFKYKADDDVLSGMFTGIIMFAQDAFSDEEASGSQESIKEIQMNNKNIMVEKGKYTYFAMVFSGRSGKGLHQQSRKVLQAIEKNYAIILKKWDGNIKIFSSANKVIKGMAK